MPYKILVVDDDLEFREELGELLSDDYDVVEVKNGEEAARVLHQPNAIDMVILDVMMPGMRGTDLLKEIKRTEPDLGVIILTGYSTKDVAVEALRGHADEYVEKPVAIEQLQEKIEKVLRLKKGLSDIANEDSAGKVEKVKQFAQRNYHKKVCLNDAAKEVYLSPKYLSRVFKEKTGASFSEYRLQLKVQKAKELLCDTHLNVSQISFRLGYENLESFIRLFKRITGTTPAHYRLEVLHERNEKKDTKNEYAS